MVRRLWGCYSVADHLEPRAFVADLLLYDRLVVPVPSDDDRERWEKRGWNPKWQDELLEILGPHAETVEWDAPLRDQFEREWSPGDAALDVDSALRVTRRIISENLAQKIAGDSDIRGIAVYQEPDRFDRDWRVTRSFPFVRRRRTMTPGELREAYEPIDEAHHDLAKLVVTRLVVPDDGEDDAEVLKRTVDLITRPDIAAQRHAFHESLASLDTEGLRDTTIIGEVEDALNALNNNVERHSNARKARIGLHAFTTLEGVAALAAPPVALVVGPTLAIGEAHIRRKWSETAVGDDVGGAHLLAKAIAALAP